MRTGGTSEEPTMQVGRQANVPVCGLGGGYGICGGGRGRPGVGGGGGGVGAQIFSVRVRFFPTVPLYTVFQGIPQYAPKKYIGEKLQKAEKPRKRGR